MPTDRSSAQPAPREGYAPVKNAELYFRDVGQGQPIIVLHGGPDFDHNYLLPDLDRLADAFRLIYYDQRGRGKSGGLVRPEEVTMQSEVDDLEALREYLHLEALAVLGHSWGGLLALEYAIRHPHRVSHLILMNSAPVSHDDLRLFRQRRRETAGDDLDRMQALSSTPAYEAGDLETDAEYYRIHFGRTIRHPDHLERVVKALRRNVTPVGIRKARAIEGRLYDETWSLPEYNLLPRLKSLSMPTLVLHGEHDFVPVECPRHIAQAIPGARLVVLPDCGHFSYLECPDRVQAEVADLMMA